MGGAPNKRKLATKSILRRKVYVMPQILGLQNAMAFFIPTFFLILSNLNNHQTHNRKATSRCIGLYSTYLGSIKLSVHFRYRPIPFPFNLIIKSINCNYIKKEES